MRYLQIHYKKILIMFINFHKYHGAGNDFVLINCTDNALVDKVLQNQEFVNHICDRRFGIGADGVLQISACQQQQHQQPPPQHHHRQQQQQSQEQQQQQSQEPQQQQQSQEPQQQQHHHQQLPQQSQEQEAEQADFIMKYYNADGKEGSLCGNGSRCSVAFAKSQGLFSGSRTRFLAIDGVHAADIDAKNGLVSLEMNIPTNYVQYSPTDFFVDTGSPHFVRYVKNLPTYDVITHGRSLRYDKRFENGANVNFVEKDEEKGWILVRTYERGVENETYACGTGAVAVAIVEFLKTADRSSDNGEIVQCVKVKGGDLNVTFRYSQERESVSVRNVHLIGPAVKVFEGKFDVCDAFL